MPFCRFAFLFFLFWLSEMLCSPALFAQERYLDSLFSVTMETHTYAEKPDETLQLDVYTPEQDSETQRPLLIYVHGGGFRMGERNNEGAVRFCRQFAQKGYVVATMSYTLRMKGKSFGCEEPASNKIETFRVAGNDIARATQFFIDRQDEFGIDTNHIILSGSSAGAEAVLHAAYWPATRSNDGEQLLAEDFTYAGAISMAGALVSLEWVTTESAIPTQFFHGTCDNLVPYSEAPHHYCAVSDPGYMPLYGAEAISGKLRELGKPYYLYSICRGRHEWASEPMQANLSEITDFMYHDVLKQEKRQLHFVHTSDQDACPAYPAFPYCE